MTLNKEFKKINKEKTGKISKEELKFIINHWGMKITQE